MSFEESNPFNLEQFLKKEEVESSIKKAESSRDYPKSEVKLFVNNLNEDLVEQAKIYKHKLLFFFTKDSYFNEYVPNLTKVLIIHKPNRKFRIALKQGKPVFYKLLVNLSYKETMVVDSIKDCEERIYHLKRICYGVPARFGVRFNEPKSYKKEYDEENVREQEDVDYLTSMNKYSWKLLEGENFILPSKTSTSYKYPYYGEITKFTILQNLFGKRVEPNPLRGPIRAETMDNSIVKFRNSDKKRRRVGVVNPVSGTSFVFIYLFFLFFNLLGYGRYRWEGNINWFSNLCKLVKYYSTPDFLVLAVAELVLLLFMLEVSDLVSIAIRNFMIKACSPYNSARNSIPLGSDIDKEMAREYSKMVVMDVRDEILYTVMRLNGDKGVISRGNKVFLNPSEDSLNRAKSIIKSNTVLFSIDRHEWVVNQGQLNEENPK